MNYQQLLLTVLAVLATTLAASEGRASSLKPDDPEALAKTRSLGRIIDETPTKPVHILFVHGMKADGIGASSTFLAGLCKSGAVKCSGGAPQRVDRKIFKVGPRPPARFVGSEIWRTDAEWDASQPFVDRYVFERVGAPAVVVDEVNWWPLLFPLKCRALVAPEARLSGIDKRHVELCHTRDESKRLYPWLEGKEYADVLEGPKISGGGVLLNAWVKREILNWGLSDAVLTLGPMRFYFRKAMDQAFEYASQFDSKGIDDQEFVVISESLGSFVVMDAAANREDAAPNARAVVGAASNLYFFANQFRLLELGRIGGLPSSFGLHAEGVNEQVAVSSGLSPTEMLSAWSEGKLSATKDLIPPPKQIIAFSDPSDALTFDVPQLPAAPGRKGNAGGERLRPQRLQLVRPVRRSR